MANFNVKSIEPIPMQRYLLIMRHAQAVEIRSNETDKSRELTSLGKQEVYQVGSKLLVQNLVIDAIHCSSATRTSQTAILLAEAINFLKEKIEYHEELYNSSVSTYLDFMSKLDNNHKTILVIGHNPTVSKIVEYFNGKSIDTFPTAGVCIIKFECTSWTHFEKGNGELRKVIFPDLSNKLNISN